MTCSKLRLKLPILKKKREYVCTYRICEVIAHRKTCDGAMPLNSLGSENLDLNAITCIPSMLGYDMLYFFKNIRMKWI